MGKQTVGDLLRSSTTTLKQAGVESAHLDTLLFMEGVSGHDRAHLLAHPEMTLDEAAISKLNTFIAQRSKHIPVAYIRGRAPFFGREFIVNKSVLIPRPETEIMIEMLLKIRPTLPKNPRIIDVGTGSGCLGVTAALEIPESIVFLSDIDTNALQVASENALHHGTSIHTLHADLFNSLLESFDVVLTNLPYVPVDYPINKAASFEPTKALFAGDDGLSLYRTFWQQLSTMADRPLHVFTESLAFQHKELASLAHDASYTLVDTQDLIQHFTLNTTQ